MFLKKKVGLKIYLPYGYNYIKQMTLWLGEIVGNRLKWLNMFSDRTTNVLLQGKYKQRIPK